MILLVLVTLLLASCESSEQEPIFSPPTSMLATSSFKGLPELPSLNQTAGETRSVYYYDQIVAVIDVLNGKRLLRCELVEVYEPSEAVEVLKNLSTAVKPVRLSFKDILKLMDKCDQLDENPARALTIPTTNVEVSKPGGNPLFIGIVPGTKWCGTGDIAKSYHDLGSRTKIDRCCRNHDLCPVKIRAYKKRYNLVNNSFFSKSHCSCDETFYDCLKGINHVSANIIGNIYFNIAQPPCIEDDPSSDKNSKKFVPAKRGF